MKNRYADKGLKIISIHTPEFDYEKDRSRVERAVKRYKVDFPVYMDNDYAYWKALGNRYWPSFYLVDKAGRIRAREIGELHDGTPRATGMETILQALLKEPS